MADPKQQVEEATCSQRTIQEHTGHRDKLCLILEHRALQFGKSIKLELKGFEFHDKMRK